jgi:pSer/pThr/pTyr-binding forkhead associated (FHA) protein
MPLIRCPRCAQAYDIPPAIAVRLPMSIATCSCGGWLCGNRTALLNRFSQIGDIEDIDVSGFRVSSDAAQVAAASLPEPEPAESRPPKHLRVIARGTDESVNTVFSIGRHPLWIGRHGCHIELDDAELSIRHCSIVLKKGELVIRDADSHTGTYLDGEPITEKTIEDGVHLLRVGRALVCIEPSDEPGIPVEPVLVEKKELLEPETPALRKLMQRRARQSTDVKAVLICTEGPLSGEEIVVPADGLVVGREGTVKIHDEFLSRRHFSLGRDTEGNLRLRDLGSRNGTFLNSLPARDSRVHPGDQIRAGVSSFKVEER